MDTKAPEKVGVVFVHGLFSSPATWDSFTSLIAQDPDLAHVEVLHFGYTSPVASWNPLRRIPSFDDVADNLRHFLDIEGEGRDRLILVSHSQGGLVVQRYLARILGEGHGEDLARIKGIVMFACPNSGSELGLTFRKLFFRHPQERQLRPINEAVMEAQRAVLRGIVNAESVSATSCPIPLIAYAGETDNIVTPTSARHVFPETAILPGDHSSIIRPQTHGDRRYKALKQRILLKARHGRPTESHVGSGGAVGEPNTDFIRAVEDFVQQISGVRPDGFSGPQPDVADKAFAERAWESVLKATERVKIACPGVGDEAEAVSKVVSDFYGVYLDWVDPEPLDDYATHFTAHEPAGPDELRILGSRINERLREPLALFHERWRELH